MVPTTMAASYLNSIYYHNFAQYGCSTYGTHEYNLCTTTNASPQTGTTNLANTGQVILPGILVGTLCILASLYILFSKRLKSRKSKSVQ